MMDTLSMQSGTCSVLRFHDVKQFVFFFSINQVRWWFGEVQTMCFGFFVGREKGSVEDIVYFPGGR